MRRMEIERKRALRDAIMKGEKKAKSKKRKVDADVNKDGKVDEKDLSEVHKAYAEEKKKEKKVVKKQ